MVNYQRKMNEKITELQSRNPQILILLPHEARILGFKNGQLVNRPSEAEVLEKLKTAELTRIEKKLLKKFS